MKPIDRILKEFDKKFPSQPIMEAVETDFGTDVVEIGDEFIELVEPYKLKIWIESSLKSYAKDMLDDILPEEGSNIVDIATTKEIYALPQKGWLDCLQQIKDKAKHWIE